MAIDIGAAISLGSSLVMLGLLIWLAISVKKWYNDASKRPRWLMSILLVFSPVKYNIMINTVPNLQSNLIMVADTVSITANTCASNCSGVYDCTGFVFNRATNVCTQVRGDFGKAIMIPKASYDTYFRQDKNSPKYGFVKQDGDFAFSSNLVNQRMGSLLTIVDPYELSNTCIKQSTSNCVGFSYTTNVPLNSWIVNSTSNIESTSNVSSYALSQLFAGNWADAGL